MKELSVLSKGVEHTQAKLSAVTGECFLSCSRGMSLPEVAMATSSSKLCYIFMFYNRILTSGLSLKHVRLIAEMLCSSADVLEEDQRPSVS